MRMAPYYAAHWSLFTPPLTESVLGEGTTFHIEVPFVAVDKSVDTPKFSGLKLLALADELTARKTLTVYAEGNGATIDIAENETELLALMAEESEAIVLLMHDSSADYDRIRASFNGKRRFLGFTSNRTDELGLIESNYYVVQDNPISPLQLYRGFVILSDQEFQEQNNKTNEKYAVSDAEVEGKPTNKNKLVLLVEDNEVNQEVIQHQLEILGYKSEVADDGEQGLKKWKTGRFDLVLTDCHMPVMDGFAMTNAIRRIEMETKASRGPIIAITANALQGEADHCLASGMDDYLSKPVELERLRDTLWRCF